MSRTATYCVVSTFSFTAACARLSASAAGVSPAAGASLLPPSVAACFSPDAASPPEPTSGPCASSPRSTSTAAGSISAASVPLASATRRVSVENSIAFRKPISFGPFGGWRTKSSSPSATGTSSFSRTSSREIRALSAFSMIDSRRLFCLISAARARTVSRSPYSSRSCAAVLGPIPGTPGTLSTESPVSACRSIIFSGGTPHFSTTSGMPICRSFIGSYMATRSPTSCIRSLSEDTIVASPPASRASRQ